MKSKTSVLGMAPVLVFALASCQTAPSGARQGHPKDRLEATRILPKTALPTAFNSTLAAPETKLILVPVGMLSVSEVTRPRAEVRSGPGAQFEVLDGVLMARTPVMVFNTVGVWRKIVVMANGVTGWMHAQALAEPRLNPVPMRVDARRLPTVLATRDVETIKEFPGQTPRPAKVPRGAMFRSLMVGEDGTLVWLPETASVMWMSRKDVQ